MTNHFDREMLQSWIGLEVAPASQSIGGRIVDVLGIGSQNIVFRVKNNVAEAYARSVLRSDIGFAIGLPQNRIFKVYNAPLLKGEWGFEEDMETFKLRIEYYQSLYDRLRLLIGSSLVAHIHPINIVCNRLAKGIIRYSSSKEKEAHHSDLKAYTHLLGDSFVRDILQSWSMLDPEQIKQAWFERSGLKVDSYRIVIDEEEIYLGTSAELSSNALSALADLPQIYDKLEINRSVELKNNPLIPYFIAFTGSYEFDWSGPDEIKDLLSKTDRDMLYNYVMQIAQISHVLNNNKFFSYFSRIPAQTWLSTEQVDVLKRIIEIAIN